MQTACACTRHAPTEVETTWHDLAIRKVASEEVVVGCDVFVANSKPLGLILHYSVH